MNVLIQHALNILGMVTRNLNKMYNHYVVMWHIIFPTQEFANFNPTQNKLYILHSLPNGKQNTDDKWKNGFMCKCQCVKVAICTYLLSADIYKGMLVGM